MVVSSNNVKAVLRKTVDNINPSSPMKCSGTKNAAAHAKTHATIPRRLGRALDPKGEVAGGRTTGDSG
jgi:hypothetical protein